MAQARSTAKGKKLSKEYIKKARKRKGGSNAGDYSPKEIFAGPAGGSPEGTFPLSINGKPSPKRIASARKLAHNARNKAGLLKFVNAYAKRHGIPV